MAKRSQISPVTSRNDSDVPPTCQHFVDAIDAYNAQILQLQQEFAQATGAEITILDYKIKQLSQQIALVERLLRACVLNPPPPRPPARPFVAGLVGSASVLTDNSSVPPLRPQNIAVPLVFTPDRKKFSVAGLAFSFGGCAGAQQTVTAYGDYDPTTGAMNLPITFALSGLPSFLIKTDATVDFQQPGLTTEAERPLGMFNHKGGWRLDRANGQLVLVGTAPVTDNIALSTTNVELTVIGVVTPIP